MRDIIEEVFATQPLDPTQAARRGMRSSLRRRFYEAAGVAESEGFRIALDGRPVRTPGRRMLAAPTRALAQALACEWEAQRDVIDPAKMPLTRLANAIIDGVTNTPSPVAAEIEKYFGCDLVLYRAASPAALRERQRKAWDPVLVWARETLGAAFVPTSDMTFMTQPAQALAAARAAIPRDPWRLGAVHTITTLTGSGLIALAVAGGALPLAQAWDAAHVDEDWNMELWGQDALALEQRASRFAEMDAAVRVLEMA